MGTDARMSLIMNGVKHSAMMGEACARAVQDKLELEASEEESAFSGAVIRLPRLVHDLGVCSVGYNCGENELGSGSEKVSDSASGDANLISSAHRFPRFLLEEERKARDCHTREI